MSWSAVGSIIQAFNVATFSLTPGNVGDLILIEVQCAGATTSATALSSSNVTWVTMGSLFTGFVPLHWPARIRPALPPRGRIAGSPGGPVRNPTPGPAFRQAVWPIRAVIPQNAPRGRASGNPGGPVQNIPLGNPLVRLGSPRFQWDTDLPAFRWDTSSPAFRGTRKSP